MTRRRLFRLGGGSGVAVAGLLAVLAACGTDGDNVARATGDAASDGLAPDAAIVDASTEKKPKDAACPLGPPDAEAPIIQDEFVMGSRPAAAGGEIVPGRYFLTKSEIYIGDGNATIPPREAGALPTTITRTVVLTGDVLSYTEGEGTVDGGIDERDDHVQAYAPAGAILVLQELCPERDSHQIEFSAMGSELHLFPSATQREVLTRQP